MDNHDPKNEELNLTFEEYYENRKDDLDKIIVDPEDVVVKASSPLISWTELNRKPKKEQAWRIDKIIPEEGMVIIASASGERKTWMAMKMTRDIVMGVKFLGENGFDTKQCNVLYMNCENSEGEIRRRAEQLEFPEDGEYKIYLFNGYLNFNDRNAVRWLFAVIEYYQIKVVFVDTFRATAGGLKEEKAEEVRTFFGRFNALKNRGVAIVWLDHFRKPSNFDGKVPKKEHLLGSQDKCASVETLLMMRSEAGSDTIECYQRKNRLAPETDPFRVVMVDHIDDQGKKHTSLTHDGKIDDEETKKDIAKDQIIEILENGGRKTKEIIEMLRKQVGAKNVRAALKELYEKDKLIDFVKSGRENYYFIPEEKGKNEPKTEDKNIDDEF